jgi:hypothetical protein
MERHLTEQELAKLRDAVARERVKAEEEEWQRRQDEAPPVYEMPPGHRMPPRAT